MFTLFLLSFSLFATENGYSLFNPAKLTDLEKVTLSLSLYGNTDPRIHTGEGVFAVPLGLYKTGALKVKKHRKVSGFDGFSSTFLYANNPWNRLSLGVALGYLRYDDGIKHHRGLFDLGAIWYVTNHPVIGQHEVGICANNLFFAPSGLREQLETPTNIHAQWDGAFWDKHIKVASKIGVNLEDTSLMYKASIQYEHFFIGGLKAEITDEYWRTSIFKEFRHSIRSSLSFSYGQYRDGEGFIGAWFSQPIGSYKDFIYSKKMARLVDAKPGDLWTKMLRAYSVRDFYPALKYGGNLVVEFPDFFQNSLAYYYLGNIFQELDLRDASQKALLFSESKFPASKAVNYCRLAQLKVAVRDKGDNVDSLYALLQDSQVPDSIRGVSHYYMGEHLLQKKEYVTAIECYKKVPTTVNLFNDAQREGEIANYFKNHSTEKFVITETLLQKLDAGRAAYEKAGLEFYDLLKAHPTSYTIGRMKELEEDMVSYWDLVQEYKQLIENEKNRIYQLSQQ